MNISTTPSIEEGQVRHVEANSALQKSIRIFNREHTTETERGVVDAVRDHPKLSNEQAGQVFVVGNQFRELYVDICYWRSRRSNED